MVIYTIEEPLRIVYSYSRNDAERIFEKVKEKISNEVYDYLHAAGYECEIHVMLCENYTSKSAEDFLLETLNNVTPKFDVTKVLEDWSCPAGIAR